MVTLAEARKPIASGSLRGYCTHQRVSRWGRCMGCGVLIYRK